MGDVHRFGRRVKVTRAKLPKGLDALEVRRDEPTDETDSDRHIQVSDSLTDEEADRAVRRILSRRWRRLKRMPVGVPLAHRALVAAAGHGGRTLAVGSTGLAAGALVFTATADRPTTAEAADPPTVHLHAPAHARSGTFGHAPPFAPTPQAPQQPAASPSKRVPPASARSSAPARTAVPAATMTVPPTPLRQAAQQPDKSVVGTVTGTLPHPHPRAPLPRPAATCVVRLVVRAGKIVRVEVCL